jgi:alkylresorcinol/alkylpyrone synthase
LVSEAVLLGTGYAVPGPLDQAQLWDGFFAQRYHGHRVAAAVWASAGIATRHGVLDPRLEDPSSWDTGRRMRRFVAEGMPLGKGAAAAALDDAGVAAADVGLFCVVSCTGYATPGLDILLARDLGMTADVQRLGIGHMGCYAAVPALAAVADYVRAHRRPAVLLCVELPSLHVQPPTDRSRDEEPDDDELQQMVAHSLFSDAAAAVVLGPGAGAPGRPDSCPAGLDVLDVVARTDASTADCMTWDVTGLGFRMGLSPRVPDELARHCRPVVDELLRRNGLGVEDVAGWAVHPGGRRILEVVAEQLELPGAALGSSYRVLRDFGNCSSATVLLVLRDLLRTDPPPPGGPVVFMAFGPGLTLYAALLRQR